MLNTPPSQTPPRSARKPRIKQSPIELFWHTQPIAEFEESRQLTHEEIWDDSALISAGNAATEEYEAYHGTDKIMEGPASNEISLSRAQDLYEQDAMVKEEEGLRDRRDEEERSYGATQEPAVALNGPPAPPQDYASGRPRGISALWLVRTKHSREL
ncbi:hypothetical protein BKA70DRAFT_1395395 [Coprinopsis sp. MPI-PUGE-AT-0042]|nr:hypothetical protein BKA70DRAFT_1395395 [Coprinopsis sp. MPI-PUGE-AT-0042]